jgi:hypothetical protein
MSMPAYKRTFIESLQSRTKVKIISCYSSLPSMWTVSMSHLKKYKKPISNSELRNLISEEKVEELDFYFIFPSISYRLFS